MIPVEVGLPSYRRNFYDQEENEAFLQNKVDLIEEKCEEAQSRVVVYQQQVTRYYNSKVKEKSLKRHG